MIVYDDVSPLEKIRIFDARVERPPHYDTFAEFHYAYHYGDVYIPYIKQEEPLKNECQHFLDCIQQGTQPLTSGNDGLELVRILEASSESLRQGGAPVGLSVQTNGHDGAPVLSNGSLRLSIVNYKKDSKKMTRSPDRKPQVKLRARGR
jgi:hypothetical protein